jgi:hypothetical protein
MPPASVVVLPPLLLLATIACSHGRAAEVRLGIAPVVAGSPVTEALVAHLADDPEAEALGLKSEHDLWSHFGTGAAHLDVFILGPDRATLERWVSHLIAEGVVVVPDGEAIAYGPSLAHPGDWRTFVVRESDALRVSEVAGLSLVDTPFGDQAVNVRFTPEDGAAFAELTARYVGHKLAILVGDEVEMAPVLQETIAGGRLQITVRGDPDALLRRLRGE